MHRPSARVALRRLLHLLLFGGLLVAHAPLHADGGRSSTAHCGPTPIADSARHQVLFPAMVGSKWCYINKRGDIVIQPRFDWADNFSEGLASVRIGDKYGFIDVGGRFVVAPVYKHASHFIGGMARVVVRRESGGPYDTFHSFINKRGVRLPGRYSMAYDFGDEGFATVNQNGWGLIDRQGKVVIPLQFSEPLDLHEGLAAVKRDGKFGFVDAAGRVIVQPMYDDAHFFSCGLAPVAVGSGLRTSFVPDPANPGSGGDKLVELGVPPSERPRRYGFIDRAGRTRIGFAFDDAESFVDGVALVKQHGKWGHIDQRGRLLVKPQFEQRYYFSEGLAWVETVNGRGLVDRKGHLVLRPNFIDVLGYQSGLAAVWVRGGHWGFIDRTGKMVLPPVYSTMYHGFQYGLALVETPDESKRCLPRYIDTTGKVVFGPWELRDDEHEEVIPVLLRGPTQDGNCR